MDQFTPTTVGDWIGLILFGAVVIYGLYKLFESYADSQPIYDPFVHARNDEAKSAAVERLMRMESLRTPLKNYKNPTPSRNASEENNMTTEEHEKARRELGFGTDRRPR